MRLRIACSLCSRCSPAPADRPRSGAPAGNDDVHRRLGAARCHPPDFEEQHHARVDVVAVGTGQAIELGEAGDADVILVHARAKEEAFVAEGHGTARFDVMYNDFIIVGPSGDPAGIAGITLAAMPGGHRRG